MDNQSQKTLQQLIQTQQIASLGTVNNGEPMVSMVMYAPSPDFLTFYIHISQLAKHTKNIIKQPQVALMICETLKSGQNPQTLARISIKGEAQLISPNDEAYKEAQARYVEKNPGGAVNFQLGDFSLYGITFKSARYVAGFGKIFNLTKRNMLQTADLK